MMTMAHDGDDDDGDSQLSSMRKQGHCCLSLSQLPKRSGALRWDGVIEACKANRLAPLTPPEFETMMTEGMASGEIKFTVRRPPSIRQPVSWC